MPSCLLRSVSALALGLLALGVAAGDARAGGPPDAVHLALGDSLAVGTGAPVEGQTGYVPRLFHAGHGAPLHLASLTNLSKGGETSATFITDGQLAAALAAIADPTTDIGLVSLVIGGDDLLPLLKAPVCLADPAGAACQLLVSNALQAFAVSFPTIVGSLQGALASDPAPLVVMTLYNPFSGSGNALEGPVDAALLGADGVIDCSQLGAPPNVGMNDLIACIASAAGATVVDVYPEFAGRGALLTHIGDLDVHPTAAGYAVIGRAHIRAVR